MTLNTLKAFNAVQVAYQISSQLNTPLYLAGGAVRDTLMGFFNGKDFDFVLGNKWEQVARLFAQRLSGKIIPWDFNQVRVIIKEQGHPVTIDFALFRARGIVEDLKSRDFTINSMAVSVKDLFRQTTPRLHDPLNGIKDLQERRIKADGHDTFDQDPLRILRAIRFAAAFKFTIENRTQRLLRTKAFLLPNAARERIKRELFSILNAARAGEAVRQLSRLNIINTIIPALERFSITQQGPPHQYDLMEHSLRTIEHLSAIIDNPEILFDRHAARVIDYLNKYVETGIITRRSLLMFAGLLHDSGKLLTRTAEKGRIRFLGHEKQGQIINLQIARSLLLGRRAQRILATITSNHMRILQLARLKTMTAHAQRRLLQDIEEAPFEVMVLALADALATSTEARYQKTIDRVKQRIGCLGQALFAEKESIKHVPLVTGADIKELLHIPESREVGDILREIATGERSGTFNSREEVLEWLKKQRR